MTNATTSQTTALQVTNFNFYGDDLVAIRDNTTGEIYTSINHILKGIGFTNNEQIRRRRDKWINDVVIGKGVTKFQHPSDGGYQETYCISQHKLPLALAKINIIPSMKKKQPELVSRLELYQDKCADVLASVFIDYKIPNQVSIQQYIQPMINAVTTLTQTINDTLQSMNDRISKLEELQQPTQPTQLPQSQKNGFPIGHQRCFQNINCSWIISEYLNTKTYTNNFIGN